MSAQMMKYLQSFLPFINGIHNSIIDKAKSVLDEAELGVFIVFNHNGTIEMNNNITGRKMRKYIDEKIPSLPKQIENQLYSELKNIKNTLDKKQRQKPMEKSETKEIEIMMKDAFIQVFVELFYDYNNYLTILANNPVFNINALLLNRPSSEQKFYRELSEGQNFQLFIQTVIKEDEYSMYFLNRLKKFHSITEKNKIEILKRDFQTIYLEFDKINSSYVIYPKFLKIKPNLTMTEIENILKQTYTFNESDINENGIHIENKRVSEKMIPLKYPKPSNFYDYYCIIKDKINTQIQKKKKSDGNLSSKLIKGKGELSQNEVFEIQNTITEILHQVLTSQKFNVDTKLKELIELIKKPYGRNFFMSSIFQEGTNKRSEKMINNEGYELLYKTIYGLLLELLTMDEREILSTAVRLVRSTQLYYKVEKKKKLFIFDEIIGKLTNYALVLKKEFWEIWLAFCLGDDPSLRDEDFSMRKNEQATSRNLIEMTNVFITARFKCEFIYTCVLSIAKKKITDSQILEDLKKILGEVVKNYKVK